MKDVGTSLARSREIYLNLTYRCTNSCVFCASWLEEGVMPPGDITLVQLQAILGRLGLSGTDRVILNGGEPTVLKYLPNILQLLFSSGARTILFTNGRRFSSPGYSRSMAKGAKNLEIQIPIHGRSDDVHDSFTRRRGSFKESVQGITNLLALDEPGLVVVVKTLVCKPNYNQLSQTAEMFAERFYRLRKVIFSSLIYDGRVLRNVDSLHFAINEAGHHVSQAIRILHEAGISVFLHRIPVCVLEESAFLLTLNSLQSGHRDETNRSMIYFDASVQRECLTGRHLRFCLHGNLPPECVICKYYDVCPGFEETYVRRFGAEVVDPTKYLDVSLFQ